MNNGQAHAFNDSDHPQNVDKNSLEQLMNKSCW